MRHIDPAFQAHLASDATTVCHAWRVRRRDGVTLGFTEHDSDLIFAETRFLAASGFAASATEEESGLPAATSEVTGGFSNDAICETDLMQGLFDGARIEVFLVNWAAPEQHLLLKIQEIGEVTRTTDQFRAELRSVTHRLNQAQGRVYNRRCDAALGDRRCQFDLGKTPFTKPAQILGVTDSTRLILSGLPETEDGFFRYGHIHFLDGPAKNTNVDIETHRMIDTGLEVGLWLPMVQLPEVGNRVQIIAGCDKSFAVCRAKFGNQLNFQGFPHMPGSDFAYGYATGNGVHDGGAIFK